MSQNFLVPQSFRSWVALKIAFGLGLGLFAAPQIASATTFTLVGSGLLSTPFFTATSAAGEEGEIAPGGGFLLGTALGRGVQFELGAIYQLRNFKVGGAKLKSQFVDIPALIKVHLGSALFIGVGGYYDVGTGKLGGTQNGATINSSYAASGYAERDYGLLTSGGVRFAIGKSTALLFEGRYKYGLANQVATNTFGKLYFRDLQALVGLQFGMGSTGGK